VRDDQAGVDVGTVTENRHTFAVLGKAGVPPRFASAVLPGTGRAAATTSRVSASTMTCTFAENQ
jgi:hypothetical protein